VEFDLTRLEDFDATRPGTYQGDHVRVRHLIRAIGSFSMVPLTIGVVVLAAFSESVLGVVMAGGMCASSLLSALWFVHLYRRSAPTQEQRARSGGPS
jgi:hypothetical protein